MLMGKPLIDDSSGRSSSLRSSDRSEDARIIEEDEVVEEGRRTPFNRLLPFLRKKQKEMQRTGAKLKQQYSANRLWCLIVTVTLPMIAAQICSLALYPPHKELVLNEDESDGCCKYVRCSRMLSSRNSQKLDVLQMYAGVALRFISSRQYASFF